MKRSSQTQVSSRGPSGASGSGFFNATSWASTLSYLAEPPSFAAVADPNVVVSLKSLLKRDDTTKAKALDDLIQYVRDKFKDGSAVDEGLVYIWVQLYPRIAINNSRRVRELSHVLQVQVMKSARKYIERYIPLFVGPWLAGLYDRDRLVAKTAQEGLASFLNTPEKVSAFWNRCQGPILDYAMEAVRETRETLSDERVTTATDAKAKYCRVISSSLSLVVGLLQLGSAAIQPSLTKLDDFFAEEIVWKGIKFQDAHVRKSACQLLFMCIECRLPYADTVKVRETFITSGLKRDQTGSALEYVRALTKLTQQHPDVWKSSPGDTKSPLSRLRAFIAKGSQGSPQRYWECLDQLLTVIPVDSLTLESASALLESIKSGNRARDELRTHSFFAWKCFVETAKRCLGILSPDDQVALTQQQLSPLVVHYIFSTPNKPVASPYGSEATDMLAEIHIAMLQNPQVAQTLTEDWNRLETMLSRELSASLPEVSKDFEASQANIGEQGRRWFGLVGSIHARLQLLNISPDCTIRPSSKVVTKCIELLENRNLKPKGAAQTLECALNTAPHLLIDSDGNRLSRFLISITDDMQKVVSCPSFPHLLSCLSILRTIPGREIDYEKAWSRWTEATMGMPTETPRIPTLAKLISQHGAAPLARVTPALQDLIHSQTRQAVEVTAEDTGFEARSLLEAAISGQALDSNTCRRVASDLVALLEKDSCAAGALDLLESMAQKMPAIFAQEETLHTDLVARLLGLTELSDSSLSSRASHLRSVLDGRGEGKLSVVEIIQANLETAGPQSLKIGTLASQAKGALDDKAGWEDVCPNTNVWMADLFAQLEKPVNPSLAITSSIAGAVTLPRHPAGPRKNQSATQRDRQGRSVPARMALYTARMLSSAPPDIPLHRDFYVELLYLQLLCSQLAADQIITFEDGGLWKTVDDESSRAQAEELVRSSRTLFDKILTSASDWDKSPEQGLSAVVGDLVNLVMKEASQMTPRGVYGAKALAELMKTLTEAHGSPSNLEEKFLKPDILTVTPKTTLLAGGLMAGFGGALESSKATSKFLNRLVSDVAATSPDSASARGTLVLLSLCAQVYEPGQLPAASNRIVFAVKQITSWTKDVDELDADFCADICRALIQLFPCIETVYGSYWERALQFCVAVWERADLHDLSKALPLVHASLRLYGMLETMSNTNDDLHDALRDMSAAKCRGLLELMRLPREGHAPRQPLAMIDTMLSRETAAIPDAQLPDPTSLFPLVASTSREVQTAAYEMLHRKMNERQEEQAFNILIDKTVARLPDELLSLLLDPPTLKQYSDEALALFPSSLRCYLLSWKLLFDAFSTPSIKVRNDFAEHLRSGDHVRPLLDFLFDVLGHSAAHPLNLDKESIGPNLVRDYDARKAEEEVPERNMHWLLTHLYYQVLRFVPGLFRAWYLDCRIKQTRIAVETWTVKYFSPLIVADALDKVQAWADTQDRSGGSIGSGPDDKELLIKVFRSGREVQAGYEIDDTQASILIRMPNDYPIGPVTVTGLRRVAMSERKWQGLIMTTQGVIAFSNGSIIDGLQVFQHNVAGALRGQSECAICYSIISADRRMPDKRCSTCKQCFHRYCLYKWFQSSNQNSCPLCRNPIEY